MNFLYPLGLLGLLALIPVIALYFLKLKREERTVPSTLLWKKVLDDMQVNSPFQRLKYSLLLLLQILLIALLAFALGRPYLSLAGYAGTKFLVLIDTSASMSTKDAGPQKNLTRLEAAVKAARQKIDDLRDNDSMMIVAFDRDVRQLTKWSNDRTYLKSMLDTLEPRDLDTRADEAIETALALRDTESNVQGLVLSDGCFGNVKLLKKEDEIKGNLEDNAVKSEADEIARKLADFKFVSFGSEDSDNCAITQMDARTRPVKATDADGNKIDALETQVFVMVENFSTEKRDVMLSISTADQKFAPKLITLKGRSRKEEGLNDKTADGTTIEASRSVEVFKLPLGTTGIVTAKIEAPKDRMPIDDTASVIAGSSEGVKLLVVSKENAFGKLNYFLEKALASMKGLTINTITPDQFQKEWDQKGQMAVDNYDACVFDEFAPIAWQDGGAMFLGALPPVPGFAKTEKVLEFPQVVDWDIAHPVMRYVNFGNVTIAKGQQWTVPKTARQVVEGSGGPLITAFETDRIRVVGISFDGFSSDWALRPSWPLFLRNAVPWLADASPRRRPASQRTGEPIVIPPGLGSKTANLIKPNGQVEKDIELSEERTVFVRGTEKAGIYKLDGIAAEPEGRL
ncbi:MAG TPA: VWA domain-containing protein, partial [Planctomycetota bacterium]|nr:VWA domain-containing protein [Planctomycetota bacterium]